MIPVEGTRVLPFGEGIVCILGHESVIFGNRKVKFALDHIGPGQAQAGPGVARVPR